MYVCSYYLNTLKLFLFRRQHEHVPERELEGTGTRPGAANRRTRKRYREECPYQHIWTRSVWRELPGNSVEHITKQLSKVSTCRLQVFYRFVRVVWVWLTLSSPSPDSKHTKVGCRLVVSSQNVIHDLRQLTSWRRTKKLQPIRLQTPRISARERTMKNYCYGQCSKNIGTKYE